MKNFEVSVKKLTDEGLMREACEMTFLGTSKQSLLSIYKSEHSPVRTQLFWVTFKGIPLFVSTHLLRHHVGAVPYQLTCRDDRTGGNPNLKARVDEVVSDLREIEIESRHGDLDWVDFDKMGAVVERLDNIAENCDRYTPVNLGILLNAQSVIDMSKLRLCFQAHSETIEVFSAFKEKLKEVDSSLPLMMVKKCVYRGGICGEPRCCGYNNSTKFVHELEEYVGHFTTKQRGVIVNSMP